MRSLLLGLSSVLLLSADPRAQADRPMFPLQFVSIAPSNESGIHAADVDRDGDLDLLTASGAHLDARLGDGRGFFPDVAATIVANSTAGLAVGDVDGDGLPDAALSDVTNAGVRILIGTGAGGFASGVLIPVGSAPSQPVLADFDGDGDLDLAVGRTAAGRLAVALGDGAGGFGGVAPYLTAGLNADDLAAADLDADGDVDLVLAFGGFAGLQVFRNDGRGGFVAEAALATPSAAADVLIADLTGDGRPDLVATGAGGSPVKLLAGQPGGTFAAAQGWGPSLAGNPHSLAAGDVDGDGDADVVVGKAQMFDVDSAQILVNDGQGSATLVAAPASYNIGPVALADVNHDGLLDLLTASATGDAGVAVVLNALDPLFEAPARLDLSPLSVRVLAHGDLQGDGTQDLFVGMTTGAGVTLLSVFAGAPPTLVAQQEVNLSGAIPLSLWAGDLDGDGDADSAMPDASADTVVVVPGGPGGLGAPQIVPTSLDPQFVTGADVDGDGDIDLVTTHLVQDTLDIILNDGAGGFAAPQPLAVANSPRQVVVSDLDGNGSMDLAISHSSPNDLMLYFADGEGGFAAPVAIIVGENIQEFEVSDLDLDGDADIVLVDNDNLRFIKGLGGGTFSTVAVIPSGAQQRIDIGDVDGDGLPDVVAGAGGASVLYLGADAFAPSLLFNGQELSESLLADLDGDGALDLALGGIGSIDLEVHRNVADQWGPLESVGAGLAGAAGTPHWSGLGTLQPLSPLSLALADAKPGAPLTLVIGASLLEAPFKGGTMVPFPQLLVAGLAANATGALSLSTTWPAGIPSGFLLATQCWIVDPAGPAGLAASNGLVLTAP